MPTLRLAFAVASLLLGCGGSTDSDPSGSSGSGGAGSGGASSGGSNSGGAPSGGSGGIGGCTSLVPCCDANGNQVDYVCQNGMPVCPAGSSFPSSGVCSPPTPGACSPTVPCTANEYCDYPDDKCGDGASGTCTPRPIGCDFLYAPVCTCSGIMAANDCVGYSEGHDVSAKGNCAPPSGTFACGSLFCEIGMQYCQHGVSDVGGEPDSFACLQVPSSCGKTPMCSCLASEPCGQWCEAAGLAQLTLTCPGG